MGGRARSATPRQRLHLATGAAEVLASLQRSLSGVEGVITAPLPPSGPEHAQTYAMLQPDLPVTEPDAAAVVATSGSTGRPRGVVLSRTALVASAQATATRLNGPGSWVLALPAHYVAGLMVLVRAVVGDRPAHLVDGRLTGLPNLVENKLGADSGPCYTALVPTQLSRALADPALTRALTRFDAILLGGAAADPSLLARAAAAGIRVVTTYGMSETCGGCVYDGLPLDGVTVSIDELGTEVLGTEVLGTEVLGTEEQGRISIGGPLLFSGYRLDPRATADVLVDGRLRTRDRGQLGGGRLTVLGRLDDIVISGGMNVDLAAVERAVRAWTTAEAAVVGLPHPEWGTEVVAVVETRQELPVVQTPPPGSGSSAGTNDDVALSELRESLSADLPHYALPRQLLIQTLPRTSSGKIDRRRLVADLSSSVADLSNSAESR